MVPRDHCTESQGVRREARVNPPPTILDIEHIIYCIVVVIFTTPKHHYPILLAAQNQHLRPGTSTVCLSWSIFVVGILPCMDCGMWHLERQLRLQVLILILILI